MWRLMLRCIAAVRIFISASHIAFIYFFFFLQKEPLFYFSNLQRHYRHHTLYIQKSHFIAYYNSITNVFLFMNNRIIYCSTPHRRDDSAFLFCVKPRLYPLPSRPIICMLSILSCCLCHFPTLFHSPCGMIFTFSVRRSPWSSEMESLSRVCVSLLTADWIKGTKIKTSVNCIKGR